jgi:glutamate racemase
MKYPLAIIDYGIGGLGLLKLIKKDFQKLPVLYFSDSGETPYGKLSRQALRTRMEKVFAYLFDQGVEKIVVACHAASSVVLASDKNVISLRQPTLEATLKHRPKRVGILGGGRTIRSGYYKRQLQLQNVPSDQRVGQILSILIERGEVDSMEVENAVKKIVAPLHRCDCVLLACTHYPVLNSVFKRHLRTKVKLIDPAEALYASIKRDVRRASTSFSGKSVFLTTGNTKLMKKAAAAAFGVLIENPRKVVVR